MSEKISKESGINRIAGLESQDQSDILAYFKRKFKESDIFSDIEKEKTEELNGAIALINGQMKEFLDKYGIISLPIPHNRIHILDRSKLSPEQLEMLTKKYSTETTHTTGFYLQVSQEIWMLEDFVENSKMPFLQVLVHEMLHANAFNSLQPGEKENSFELTKDKYDPEKSKSVYLHSRRSGFKIHTRDGDSYFSNIDEAIINELTMRFDWAYFNKIPTITEEWTLREESIEAISKRDGKSLEEVRRTLAHAKKMPPGEDGGYEVRIKDYGYSDERSALNKLVHDIYEKNQLTFSSQEEVFEIFTRAVLTGHLLPVARLIEKTYGKGSFRRIGEETQKKNKQFIESDV